MTESGQKSRAELRTALREQGGSAPRRPRTPVEVREALFVIAITDRRYKKCTQ